MDGTSRPYEIRREGETSFGLILNNFYPRTHFQRVSAGAPSANLPILLDGSGLIDNSFLNTGSGNGIDADTVDGEHASAFADAVHTHAHDALSGLGDDDHTQYFLVDGSRSITGDIVMSGTGATISFEGTAGTEGILYEDSGGNGRYGLLFPGSDIVALANRAANGVVHLRANTSSAGGAGEVTVVTVEDTHVYVNGNMGIGTASPVTTLDVNGNSLWVRGDQTGGLGSTAGKGIRIGYSASGDYSLIFAYDYGASTPKDIVLQIPGGDVGIGVVPSETLHIEGSMRLQGVEGGSAMIHLYADQGDDNNDRYRIFADTSGNFYITHLDSLQIAFRFSGSANYMPYVYSNTTASAANVFVASGGLLSRSTSSRKYKTDITALPNKWGWPFIRQLNPVVYRSTSNIDDPETIHVGLVAEDVHDLTPTEHSPYVFYGEDDYPESVQYERLVVPLILTAQQQADVIRDLRQRVETLESR